MMGTEETFLRAVNAAVRAEWVARAARARSVRRLDRDAELVRTAASATAAADRAWELVRCSVPPVGQEVNGTVRRRRRR
ncbi:MAG: hypothetical protein HY905_04045 [Deltaproteobacteria bacterium]|nr:hypothetical protein [Deltaproteobacteria bacterium]